MRKIVLTILIGLVIISCKDVQYQPPLAVEDTDSTIDTIQENEVIQKPLDSLAIGNIYLGIDEPTFYEKRDEFLRNNPTLNGVEIDTIEGKFYRGKLYYIKVRSVRVDEPLPDTRERYTQEELERRNNADYVWSSIYKKKYRNSKYVGDSTIKYLTLKKGKCTIKVYDKFLPDYSLEELRTINQLYSNGRKPREQYCSYIYIFDQNVLNQIERDKEKHKQQETNKSLDVI